MAGLGTPGSAVGPELDPVAYFPHGFIIILANPAEHFDPTLRVRLDRLDGTSVCGGGGGVQ